MVVFKENRRFGAAKPGDGAFWPETSVLAGNLRFGPETEVWLPEGAGIRNDRSRRRPATAFRGTE